MKDYKNTFNTVFGKFWQAFRSVSTRLYMNIRDQIKRLGTVIHGTLSSAFDYFFKYCVNISFELHVFEKLWLKIFLFYIKLFIQQIVGSYMQNIEVVFKEEKTIKEAASVSRKNISMQWPYCKQAITSKMQKCRRQWKFRFGDCTWRLNFISLITGLSIFISFLSISSRPHIPYLLRKYFEIFMFHFFLCILPLYFPQ